MTTVRGSSNVRELESVDTGPEESVDGDGTDSDPLWWEERFLVGLELVLALGALVGGGGMLLDTSGRAQGLPVDLLNGTPFGSFLIPGVVLLALNGVLPAVVAVHAVRRRPHSGIGHLCVAAALAGWLAGETLLIGLASWMQPFFFAYAIVIAALAGRLRRAQRVSRSTAATGRRGDGAPVVVRVRTNPGLALALTVLGAGLALNSVLGPLLTDTIRYPFSETLRNQTIGLEAVTLFLVAPLCVVSGFLVWRGHPVGPIIAFGPAAYAAYMLVQYLIGPGYLYCPRVLPFHLALFILSGVVAVGAWSSVDASTLPPMTSSMAGRRAKVLVLLAGFVLFRYLPVLAGSWSQDALASEFSGEPGMFWSILVLDLGIVVPAVIYVAISLRQRKPIGVKGMYAVLGWFCLVPPSVAAMALTMLLRNDAHRSMTGAVVLITAAVAFSSYGIAVFLPVLRSGTPTRIDQLRTDP